MTTEQQIKKVFDDFQEERMFKREIPKLLEKVQEEQAINFYKAEMADLGIEVL